MVQKENIESAKFMRVAAMLLVVLIHATGVGVIQLTPETPSYFLYLFLNRFTRFEGAVFVFLSGLLLFYNYADKPKTFSTWKRFYKKRFLYILAPFLLWSIFYEWYAFYTGARSFDSFSAIAIRIVTGDSYYQLYFIFILTQLYFLTPLFIYLTSKSAFIRKYLLVIGFMIELISQVLLKYYEVNLPVPLFLSYIASFLFGGWLAIHYKKFNAQWPRKKLAYATTTFITLGLVYTTGYYYLNVVGIAIPYIPLAFT